MGKFQQLYNRLEEVSKSITEKSKSSKDLVQKEKIVSKAQEIILANGFKLVEEEDGEYLYQDPSENQVEISRDAYTPDEYEIPGVPDIAIGICSIYGGHCNTLSFRLEKGEVVAGGEESGYDKIYLDQELKDLEKDE